MPRPVDCQHLSSFSLDDEYWQAWQVLAESNLVLVPQDATHCHQAAATLILSLKTLLSEEQRAHLVSQIAHLSEQYTSVVCVFIERSSDPSRDAAESELDWKRLQDELREAHPRCVVRFYLVGLTATDGRLVTKADQAAVVAHAVLADIVLPDRHAQRFLVQSNRRPQVLLGLLGMSGEIRSQEQVATCLVPRLMQKLIDGSVNRSQAVTPVPIDLPTAPWRAIELVFQQTFPFSTSIGWAETLRNPALDTNVSALSCAGRRLRISIATPQTGAVLGLPGVEQSLEHWQAKLAEYDESLLTHRATLVARLACEQLAKLQTKDREAIEIVLRDVFATSRCVEQIREVGQDLIDRIVSHRNSIEIEPIKIDLSDVIQLSGNQVRRLERWKTWNWVSFLSLMGLTWITWFLFGTASMAWPPVGTWLVPITFSALLCTLFYALRNWSKIGIRRQIKMMEDRLQQRAGNFVAVQIHQTLQLQSDELHESTQRMLAVLLEAKGRLEDQVPKSFRALSADPIIVRPTPGSDDIEAFQRSLMQRQHELSKVAERFRHCYREFAQDLIHGQTPVQAARSTLELRLAREMVSLLSPRLELWRRYLTSDPARPFDDAALRQDFTRWSVPSLYQTRRFFSVRNKSEFTFKTAWICPTVLASRNVLPSGGVLISMNDRILALHRMIWNDEATY
jgi:hypothetical protein